MNLIYLTTATSIDLWMDKMFGKDSIPDKAYEKAAWWWVKFLKDPTTSIEKIDDHFDLDSELDHIEELRATGLACLEDKVLYTDELLQRIVNGFATEIKKKSKVCSGYVAFGSLSGGTARSLCLMLESTGLDFNEFMVPSKVEMNFYPNGITHIRKPSGHEHFYAGEGKTPLLLEELALDQERIQQGLDVFILRTSYIYAPVSTGQEYTTTTNKLEGVRYSSKQAKADSFVYAKLWDIKDEHLSRVIKNPSLLLEEPECFKDISYASLERYDYGERQYKIFSSPPGEKVPFEFGERPSIVPSYKGFYSNNGLGNVTGFFGPYVLVPIEFTEELFNLQDTMMIARFGDYVLYDTESKVKSLIKTDIVKEKFSVFRYEQGNLLDDKPLFGQPILPGLMVPSL